MRVRIYVDGLNFYYNVARVVGVKWLDLERCLRLVLEQHLRTDITIERVKFFASLVLKEQQRIRQVNYYNALQTHSPNLQITLGKFREYVKRRELATNRECSEKKKGEQVRVVIPEEKQTDVNIATAIVRDAYTESGEYDAVCLVSNDSDLAPPLTVKRELNQRIILLTPLVLGYGQQKNTAEALKAELLYPDRDLIQNFTEDIVRRCALPDLVAGKFWIPRGW